MPPSRPASASTAAVCTLGRDRRAHGRRRARRCRRRGRDRRRAARRRACRAAGRRRRARGRVTPTCASVGHAVRAQLARALLRDRAQRARDRARRRRAATCAPRPRRAACRRARAGRRAGAGSSRRCSVSPSRRPGNVSRCAQAMRGRSSSVRTGTRIVAADRAEHARARPSPAARRSPSRGRAGRPARTATDGRGAPRRCGSGARSSPRARARRRVRELGVHRAVVAALPRQREAPDRVALVRAAAGRDHHATREGGPGDDEHGQQPQSAAPPARRWAGRPHHPIVPARTGWTGACGAARAMIARA